MEPSWKNQSPPRYDLKMVTLKVFANNVSNGFSYCRLHSNDLPLLSFYRKTMCIGRPCRHLFTQYPAQHHITLKFGLPPHPHTAMSVRGCFGGLLAKACVVPSVGSSATRSARSYLMLTVCSVSNFQNRLLIVFCL